MKKTQSQFARVYAKQKRDSQRDLQRAERRNFQKNATKRFGVHPPPEQANPNVGNSVVNSAIPTTGPRSGNPYKLNEDLIRRFELSIEETADAPIEMHCGCCGIDRSTYSEWRKLARERPGSIYDEFAHRIDRALYASWRKLHAMAARRKPYEVLVRRHAEFYPSEAMRLQLSGPDGGAIPLENNFTVHIELHSPEGREQQDGEEKKFRIVQMDGTEVELDDGPGKLGDSGFAADQVGN